MAPPLLALRKVTKVYGTGEAEVFALRGIDLEVGAGEFVALMGPSGSGKSTCLNVLGCLDVPTAGEYWFRGVPVSRLDRDQLALLRRNYLGFVFQGFNLLARTTAVENVELPLVYRGVGRRERRRRAMTALAAVGLAGRERHTPAQLSGGQQQRVAIARALVSNPSVLLADEPTGNVDSARGHELMQLLADLNHQRGITIVMVTHEQAMAAYASRILRFLDGQIASDEANHHGVAALIVGNAVQQTIRQIGRNPMRSGLTTLGILIGVAAVIAMMALGRGATAAITNELSGLGQNLLFVMPGAPHAGGPPGRSVTRPFELSDAAAIQREVSGVAAVAPTVGTSAIAVYGGNSRRTQVTGSTASYLQVMAWQLASGRAFTDGEVRVGATVCLLGATVRTALFGASDPVGAVIRVGALSLRVVGTLRGKGTSTFGQDQDDFVIIPLATLQRRLTGSHEVDAIFLSGADGADTGKIKTDVEALMTVRRRIHAGEEADFTVRDMKEIAATVGSVTAVLSTLLAAIAAISLLVGGIGIMNIMLVAVSERTREIGIRLAIGARGRDVLAQFLIEAVMLSGLGGVAGITLGLGASWAATSKLGLPLSLDVSLIALPFSFSAAVGVIFGFFPARKAARMNPIDALRHE